MPDLASLAILDDYQGVALKMGPWGPIQKRVLVRVFHDTITDPDALVARLAPFEALVIMRERTPFPASLVARLPKLKLLVTTGGRNRGIDLAACAAQGITVCGTDSHGDPTVEIAWGLILNCARGLAREEASLRAGRWQSGLGTSLQGKTLGVVGLGKLGSQVARVGLAFGMRVLAWSQNLAPERCAEVGVEYASKQQLLREADVVSLHLVLSERSRGIIAAPELALMKPGAILVNTSRGPLVEQAALLAALHEGRLRAGLDVFEQEPLPHGHPLLAAPNTVLTPHIGYAAEENYRAYYQGAVEAIEAWCAGAPIRELKG
jgi:phosphoglycerate dehydrogenase-like enzyme